MGLQALCAGRTAEGLDHGIGLDSAAAAIVGILQAEQTRADEVRIVGPDQPFELRDLDHAAVALNRPRGHAVELRVAALLIVVDVATGLADQLVSRPAVQTHGDQVRHGPRGNEDRRLLAQHFRNAALEPEHGGVVAEDVVTHFGLGDAGAHGCASGASRCRCENRADRRT